MDLSDNEWDYLKQYLPEDPVRKDRRGRPWTDRRKTLNGIFWILRTGAPWKDLPERYGSHTTVHRRFQRWREEGTIERMLLAIAQDVKAMGKLDLRECFIDGTFVPAKKGAPVSGRQSAVKGPRSWRWQSLMVFQSPLAQQALARLK
jgi:transposase